MNNFPQEPYQGQPGQHPQQEQFVHPAMQQQQMYQDQMGAPTTGGKPPKKKVPVFLIIFVVFMVGAIAAMVVFKDELRAMMGKDEAVVEVVKEEQKLDKDGVFMNNETGDYIAAEEETGPVEATAEWKRRFKEGQNSHGIFYVPIATMIEGMPVKTDDAPVLEREDLSALAKPKKEVTSGALELASFEGPSTEEWKSNGSCSLTVSGDMAKGGEKSLLVANRSGASDYPTRDLSTTLKMGKIMQFTAFVQLKDVATADMKLVIVINDGSGEKQQIIEKKKVTNEKFTQLTGAFSLAVSDPLSVKLALICADDKASFYLDEVKAKSL